MGRDHHIARPPRSRALGNAIENGFKLYVQEQGGKLAGREIQYFKVDDESEPPKATDNVNKLIKRDNVDVLVGTVHSGVALAMVCAARGYSFVAVMPESFSIERRKLMRFLGAKVVLTPRAEKGFGMYRKAVELADRLAVGCLHQLHRVGGR